MLNDLLDRLRRLPVGGVALLTSAALLAACGDSTGVADPQRVALSLRTSTAEDRASSAVATGTGARPWFTAAAVRHSAGTECIPSGAADAASS